MYKNLKRYLLRLLKKLRFSRSQQLRFSKMGKDMKSVKVVEDGKKGEKEERKKERKQDKKEPGDINGLRPFAHQKIISFKKRPKSPSKKRKGQKTPQTFKKSLKKDPKITIWARFATPTPHA